MTVMSGANIDTDLTCVGCGYNLRTRPLDGACPECGRSIQSTLKFPHLARSAPRWLTSLVDSVTVLLVAFGFDVACFWMEGGRDEPLPVVLGTIAWALVWFAVWLLTRPEPGKRKRRRRVSAWVLRVLATAPYVSAFAAPVVLTRFGLRGAVALAVLLLCVLPATFLYYDRLCDAAHRLPSKRLAWQAEALCWLLPASMLVSMGGVVWLDRWPQSIGQVLTTLPMIGLGGVRDIGTLAQILRARAQLIDPLPLTVAPAAVMTLWAFAVLVQFRLAFAAAARRARAGNGR
jgi:hypothetical protein